MCNHRPTFKDFSFSVGIITKNTYICKCCNLQIVLADKYQKLHNFFRIASLIVVTMINLFIFLLHLIKLNVFQSFALIFIYLILYFLIYFLLYKKAVFVPQT